MTDGDKRRYREARSAPPRGIDRTAWNRYLRDTPFADRMPAYLLGLQRDQLDVPFVVMVPLERDE